MTASKKREKKNRRQKFPVINQRVAKFTHYAEPSENVHSDLIYIEEVDRCGLRLFSTRLRASHIIIKLFVTDTVFGVRRKLGLDPPFYN